jgi:predicted transglutaminase-like cysteine proteinase
MGILFGVHSEGGDYMTIASQVKTTLASLKSAQASLETFALGTQNQEAKQMFEQAAKTTQQVVDQINSRVQQLENEEPQYKGF